jgi:hypothetical protein
MAKNIFKELGFGTLVCMVWRGRLKVKLLNMSLKIYFEKIKLAYGIIRNIKGYHNHVFSFSNFPIEKRYFGYKIGRDLCMVLRWRLKRKAVKYDVKDRVQENKSGLWSYWRH